MRWPLRIMAGAVAGSAIALGMFFTVYGIDELREEIAAESTSPLGLTATQDGPLALDFGGDITVRHVALKDLALFLEKTKDGKNDWSIGLLGGALSAGPPPCSCGSQKPRSRTSAGSRTSARSPNPSFTIPYGSVSTAPSPPVASTVIRNSGQSFSKAAAAE